MPQVADAAVRRPSAELRPFVDRYVGYRYLGFTPGVHLGMPGRFLTVVVTFDDPLTLSMDPHSGTATDHVAMVSGLHDHAVEIRHDGNQHGIQIDLTPAGARAIFGMPAGALAHIAVDLADAWSTSTVIELRERLAGSESWLDRFAVLDDVLGRRLRSQTSSASPVGSLASDTWSVLAAADGAVRIADVATELGWSRRHLGERFTAEFGLPPKTMARLLRLERSATLLKGGTRTTMGAIAAACGYSDQAHLNRDWLRIVGRSPTAWLPDEQLPFIQDDDLEAV